MISVAYPLISSNEGFWSTEWTATGGKYVQVSVGFEVSSA